MRLSEVIRDARVERGLTQVQFAEKVEASKATVAGWELGAYRPRVNRLRTIARVLRVPYSQLLALAISESEAA